MGKIEQSVTESHMIFSTLLRDMFNTPGHIEALALWKQPQWSSEDGTEEELIELFQIHGAPAEIAFIKTLGSKEQD